MVPDESSLIGGLLIAPQGEQDVATLASVRKKNVGTQCDGAFDYRERAVGFSSPQIATCDVMQIQIPQGIEQGGLFVLCDGVFKAPGAGIHKPKRKADTGRVRTTGDGLPKPALCLAELCVVEQPIAQGRITLRDDRIQFDGVKGRALPSFHLAGIYFETVDVVVGRAGHQGVCKTGMRLGELG